ncbi:MAG: 30S ribosome-binding factor RbfA [Clostridiales bacterium]|nr:30S ribosome-binding factor RbfA [Clostridiales bacterium]
MRRNRAEIVGDEMRKVMQDIISNELKDPRVPLLTSVTQVKMTRDLSHATVFVSVFGNDHDKTEALSAIEGATGFIRYEMCKRINLRLAPELHFKLDNTLDEAARMEALIDKTLAEDKARREALGIEELGPSEDEEK